MDPEDCIGTYECDCGTCADHYRRQADEDGIPQGADYF